MLSRRRFKHRDPILELADLEQARRGRSGGDDDPQPGDPVLETNGVGHDDLEQPPDPFDRVESRQVVGRGDRAFLAPAKTTEATGFGRLGRPLGSWAEQKGRSKPGPPGIAGRRASPGCGGGGRALLALVTNGLVTHDLAIVSGFGLAVAARLSRHGHQTVGDRGSDVVAFELVDESLEATLYRDGIDVLRAVLDHIKDGGQEHLATPSWVRPRAPSAGLPAASSTVHFHTPSG